MFKFNRPTALARNVIALMAISGTGFTAMSAQTPSAQPVAVQAQPSIDLRTPSLDTSSDRLFSSSADESTAAPVAVASLHPTVANFGEAMQYGGGQRRRYGRPRYRGANTNSDGSSKYIFYGGAGYAQPIGNTYHYLTPSWGFQVGGGRQLNKRFAVPVEFDYDHFGFAGSTLTNQSVIYFDDPNPSDNGLDGSSHVWSFSVDPTYTVMSSDDRGGLGAYVVAGVGFYHKTATFTLPVSGCDPYYLEIYGICIPVTQNSQFQGGNYTSNAPGFSGGFGLTYKFSRFTNERFYAEVRYVFVDNSQRQGITVNNLDTITANSTNFYPANSNRTTYIPLKVGIRF
jgi:hypothetical protein